MKKIYIPALFCIYLFIGACISIDKKSINPDDKIALISVSNIDRIFGQDILTNQALVTVTDRIITRLDESPLFILTYGPDIIQHPAYPHTSDKIPSILRTVGDYHYLKMKPSQAAKLARELGVDAVLALTMYPSLNSGGCIFDIPCSFFGGAYNAHFQLDIEAIDTRGREIMFVRLGAYSDDVIHKPFQQQELIRLYFQSIDRILLKLETKLNTN